MSDYPGAIDSFRDLENVPGFVFDADKKTAIFAEDIVYLEEDLIAIEETLGIDPQGAYDTVSDRIAALEGGGGSGISPLSATGSINGSNAFFVFLSKPDYIVSDGVWMLEGHGWSWLVLTATMDVPPSDTLYGFKN